MKIISRYVLREHVGPLVFALTALTSLLLLNYIAKQFGNLVGKGLPWSAIAEFFLLSVPFTVAMTLPMAALVSTLYAFSRLAAENEITALKASGISLMWTLKPIVAASVVLSLLLLAFNDQVLPRANQRLSTLQTDIARKKPTFALREQVITEVSTGRFFLRANHIDETTNDLREVTIYDLSDQMRRRTIYADSGTMALTPDMRDLQLTLFDGYMQEIPRSDPAQLQRLFFELNQIRFRGVGNSFEASEGDSYRSDREMSICEMQDAYDEARAERMEARAALEHELVAFVREAVTGERPEMPPSDPRRGVTLGGLYCRVLGPLVGVEEAQAADAEEVAAVGTTKPGEAMPRVPDRPMERARPEQARTTATAADSARAARSDSARAARRLARDSARALRIAPSTGMSPRPTPNAVSDRLGALRPVSLASGQVSVTLSRILESERTMNAYDVEIHKKFSLAFACIVFALLGAPIALRFPRGGVGLVISVSLGVFALYYVGLIAGESLGNRGVVPPSIAMWGANILLGLLAAVLLARMGKEGSTARGGDAGEMLENIRVWVAVHGRRIGLPLDRRRRRTV